jgi:hypothetical protein
VKYQNPISNGSKDIAQVKVLPTQGSTDSRPGELIKSGVIIYNYGLFWRDTSQIIRSK